MNTETQKLHTAIRRYCIQRHRYWTEKYGELESGGRSGYAYTKESLQIFPRYNVLKAILVEVERHDPSNFKTLDEAKRKLGTAVSNAQDMFTEPPNGPIEQEVMKEERATLLRYIDQVTESDLASVKPLFYRRVLSPSESQEVWAKLQSAWNIKSGYWYPLADHPEKDVEAFQDSYFEKEVGFEQLRAMLHSKTINNVLELREYGPEYVIELSAFEPLYNGAEGYWCDESLTWIIYASHESSITIGGWLLEEIKRKWPSWKERIWTTPFFN